MKNWVLVVIWIVVALTIGFALYNYFSAPRCNSGEVLVQSYLGSYVCVAGHS